ncbi:hypothetical protein ACQKEI_06690 [Psychrobacter namhaensis]|uniref:Uncharacterized protein n=1 Tax=Psychrobacter namhaensis TaxID=292734 RepID=A0ABW8L811_9GAMM|nr:hypothetical protein [Psychrobacter sp. CCUG 69069]
MAIKPVSKESKYSGENGKTGWSSIGILESGKKETPRLKTGHIYPIET